ncbi:MAG: hypothetical protein INR73_17360 [Williamsia sp.]|nr:hypothetical protein [Williamsia sp.]
MLYLIQRAGHFYFNRRVPEAFRKLDTRSTIRHALKTSDRKTALRLAIAYNDQLEAYWNTLSQTGQRHSEEQYKALVERAKVLGFSYHTNSSLAELPLQDIIRRLLYVEKENYNEKHVEAILGKSPAPAILLDQALLKYFDIAKDKTLYKSRNQLRKWENPRKKAMSNFMKCIGNKSLAELKRDDMMKFRDWWIGRVKTENLVTSSANKDLIYVKTIVSTVAENLKIDLDTEHIFKKLLLTGDDNKRRLPFETSFIVSTLLKPENLKGLNEQARWVLHAFAETGAGLNELTGLLTEDIILNTNIPHIHIRPRKGRSLKTKFRERMIPLVGYALDAFKACPNGFIEYHDRPDSLSGLINKYLSEHNLMPSEQHTIYSLRHSFQDRLLAVNTPDRIQADLMGHKFGRPRYGDGATLTHKYEWMQRVRLKN